MVLNLVVLNLAFDQFISLHLEIMMNQLHLVTKLAIELEIMLNFNFKAVTTVTIMVVIIKFRTYLIEMVTIEILVNIMVVNFVRQIPQLYFIITRTFH